MGNYLFAHHFPKGFQGSPETAAAAAWFEQLWPKVAGRTLPTPARHQLGDPGADPVPSAYEVITADEVRELTTEKFTASAASATSAASNQR